MQNVNEMDLPELNVLDPDFGFDMYDQYHAARENNWLAKTPMGIMVLGYNEMKQMLRQDDKLEPANRLMTKMIGASGTSYGHFNDNFLLAQDGDDHKRIRGLVAPTFTPRNAELHRPIMKEEINRLLDEWLPKGQFEFTEFASYFPISVLCRLIGAKPEDVPIFKDHLEIIGGGYKVDDPEYLKMACDSIDFMRNYFDELMTERRENGSPDDEQDLLDLMLNAREGEDTLTDDELHYLLMVIYAAGYDTSKNLLSGIINVMIDNPDMWEKLADDRAYAKKVVEEALRHGGLATVLRHAKEDVVVNDVLIPKGTFLLFPTVFAGRDKTVFPDADSFDPDRKSPNKHFAFGQGMHICLGLFIARVQVEEALAIMATRMKNIRRTGDIGWRNFIAVTGLSKLPIEFDVV